MVVVIFLTVGFFKLVVCSLFFKMEKENIDPSLWSESIFPKSLIMNHTYFIGKRLNELLLKAGLLIIIAVREKSNVKLIWFYEMILSVWKSKIQFILALGPRKDLLSLSK